MALGNINLHNMETLLPEIDPDLLLSRENVSLALRPQVTHRLTDINIPTLEFPVILSQSIIRYH